MNAHRAAAGLVSELRPDLPPSVVDSLVAEMLDTVAADELDLAWSMARAHLYPAAIAAVRTERLIPYAARRLAELADAKPKPGDFKGRPRHLRPVDGGAA